MAARERRFRWLLRLLPGSFREEHEREILRVWRDEMREARRGVWTAALRDTLRVAPQEHFAAAVRNLRLAARRFWRSPLVSLAAILTLALGTGAAGAVFSLVNGILLEPLPWRAADRVALVWPIEPSGQRTWASFPELEDLQRTVPSLEAVAGLTDLHPLLAADGTSRELQALAVSHGLFALLGVPPALGRGFSPEDDRPEAARVVILSDAFWRSTLAADPGVIGRSLRLNDRDYAIVGVMPPSFSILPATSVLPDRVDVWVPLEPHLASRDRSVRFLHLLARLAPSATFAAASDELSAYALRAGQAFPASYAGGRWRFEAVSFQRDVLTGARTALQLLFGLVLLVLVMACANVANLLLARGEVRRTELAVRTALGAGPARLAGELLAEAFLLTLCGSLLGLAFTALAPAVLRALDPGALPRLAGVRIDARVGAFMLGLVIVTAAIFALLPLVERLRDPGVAPLLTGRSGGRTRRSARAARALVVVQTALATAVIVIAALLGETFVRLQRTELGFGADHLVTARVTLLPKYRERADMARFVDAAIAALAESPGVRRAAAVSQLPLSGAMLGSVFLDGGTSEARRIDVDLRSVTPRYFETMAIPVLRGRTFDDRDAADSPAVAIVDEAFERRLTADGRGAVGRRVRWFRQPDREIEIVGVVAAVRHRGPGEPPQETVYRPQHQQPRNTMFLAVRTDLDAAAAVDAVHTAVASVDPMQPLADVSAMTERVERSLTRARTSVMLALTLAALALTLGLIGLYGVLNVGVAHRLREFGIRIALGARPSDVRALVLREGAVLTAIGIAAGTGAAAIVATVIRQSLDVSGTSSYVLGAGLVLTCSAVAFWLPARRASGTNPLIALRGD